jgi:hypothetical protein
VFDTHRARRRGLRTTRLTRQHFGYRPRKRVAGTKAAHCSRRIRFIRFDRRICHLCSWRLVNALVGRAWHGRLRPMPLFRPAVLTTRRRARRIGSTTEGRTAGNDYASPHCRRGSCLLDAVYRIGGTVYRSARGYAESCRRETGEARTNCDDAALLAGLRFRRAPHVASGVRSFAHILFGGLLERIG